MPNKVYQQPIPRDGPSRAKQAVLKLTNLLQIHCNEAVVCYEHLRLLLANPPMGMLQADLLTSLGMTSAQAQQLLAVKKGAMLAEAAIFGDTIAFAPDDTVAPATVTSAAIEDRELSTEDNKT